MDTINLSTPEINWHILDQYSIDFIEANRVIKFSESETIVDIAYVPGITEELTIDRLRRHHAPKTVRFVAADPGDLAAAMAKISSQGEGGIRGISNSGTSTALDQVANDAPVVNLVNSLILDALAADASDIHVEVDGTTMIVRYRIDGALRITGRYELERFPAVASRIKIMANLNILETRRPQDGRITVTLGGQEIHLRVSTVPLVSGESLVLRLFNRKEGLMGPESLGFSQEAVTAIRVLYRLPYGLVLATGPTGSGKTTTLSTFLAEIRDDSKKIITLEDPVEYILPGIDQIPVREEIGMGFGSLLRRVLRQDPDIIMVGEIRDSETAELAIRAALTGHLVFATLHTNDAPSAIPRLVDMGIPPYMVGAVLRGVIAQRLVRTTCPHCRSNRKPNPTEKKLMAKWGTPINPVTDTSGCPQCSESGYIGRTAICEWFISDRYLEELIVTNKVSDSVFESGLAKIGYAPMIIDGLKKVEKGLTTIGEIRQVLPN